MRWLLWKDYRHNRLIVIAGLAILLAPYLIGVCVGCGERWIDWARPYRPTPWSEIFVGAGFYSLVLSQLTIALIGGNVLAGERVDRSTEFLYALPVTRRKLLASKLLLALLIAAAIWLIAPVLWCLVPYASPGSAIRELGTISCNVAITGVTFFCVAWFLSAFVNSPTFAVCGGLISPLLILLSFQFASWLVYLSTSHWPNDDGRIIEFWYRNICLTLAPACFAIGTWHYLRRVEP